MRAHPSQVRTASSIGPFSSAASDSVLADSVGDRKTEPEGSRAFPAEPWEPLMAWRLQSLYGPIAAAVRSVMASRLVESRPGPGLERGRLIVLQVGGHAEALASFLASDSTNGLNAGTLEYEIVPAAPGDGGWVPECDCDCAVVVDWLPGLSPSLRERSIGELCRGAREGVIVVNAFQSREVAAASQSINDLHRATRGADHPVLGRQIEFGCPDLEAVRGWLERGFASVEVHPLARASVWQAVEALALAGAQVDEEPSTADIAAAVVYPAGDALNGGHGSYRTMIVAARRPVSLELSARAMSSDTAAITMHYAVEAAAQRRALEALSHAVTVDREREREEFRATIASIAAELRELDARAEFLAREVRSRDQIIANQHAVSSETATRLTDAQADISRFQAQIADREASLALQQARIADDAARTATLEGQFAEATSQLTGFQAQVAVLQAQVADCHGQIAGLQAQIADRDASLALQQIRMTDEAARTATLEGQVAGAASQLTGFQAQVADCHRQIAGLQAGIADREAKLALQQARMTDEAAQASALEGRLAEAERVANAHHRFLGSRAGRAFRTYTRVKNRLTGRR